MVQSDIVKEFEAGRTDTQAATDVGSSTPSASPPQKIEELEILLQGKPFKLPMNAEFPVKHNGQILKTPLEKLLNSFRQGTHLEEKTNEYKKLKEQIEKDRGDLESYNALRAKYEQIQKWSEEHPDEWNKLWELYQKKDQVLATPGQAGQGNEKLMAIIQSLQEELSGLKAWKGEFESERERQALDADIKLVDSQVEEFKKEWPEIDFAEKTLDGLSLVSVIKKHGLDKGIPDFTLAATDYLRPRLIDIAVQRGRNEAVKGETKDRQQGIVARSSTPFTSGQSVEPSKMSKSDRMQAAKSELASIFSSQ